MNADVSLGTHEEADGAQPEPEPEAGPSWAADGFSPSDWGELLGILPGDGLEEEPRTLYCFETLGASDSEEDAA